MLSAYLLLTIHLYFTRAFFIIAKTCHFILIGIKSWSPLFSTVLHCPVLHSFHYSCQSFECATPLGLVYPAPQRWIRHKSKRSYASTDLTSPPATVLQLAPHSQYANLHPPPAAKRLAEYDSRVRKAPRKAGLHHPLKGLHPTSTSSPLAFSAARFPTSRIWIFLWA